MKLHSSVKGHTYDQDKVTDPETTVQNALAKLGAMGDLDGVELAPRAHAIHGSYCFHSVSKIFNASGKGLTAEQARASATMEFAERYSWLHFDYNATPGYTMRSHTDMVAAGLRVPDPAYFLANFPTCANREQTLEEIVAIPLRWVPGWSLTHEREIYYPVNWHNMVFTSNGLAAGNTLEEAIVQATCEVIEREVTYRLFVDKRPGRFVDPESVTHPLLLQAIEESRAAGIELRMVEISGDLGVPTFIVRGTHTGHEGELTYQGCGHGTHLQPEKALIRAVSEYYEGFASLATIPRETLDMHTLTNLLPPHHYGFHALLNPEMLDANAGTVRMEELEDLSLPDIKDEVEMLVLRLGERGHELFVVDKTYAPLGIPTVRVVVPDMRNCVNNDIASPDFAISEVHHEAGNSRGAMEHLVGSIMHSPFLKALRGALSQTLPIVLPALIGFDSSTVYKGDYLKALESIGGLKKGGMAMLDRMGNVQELIKRGFG